MRRARAEDLPAIYTCQAAAYAGVGLCTERHLALQFEAFPEGLLVAALGDQVIGYAAALIVAMDEETPWYSYAEITGNGTFSTHDPSGDTLYGADIAVHPDHRGRGVAGLLYEGRKKLLKRFNLRRMVAGGRIPGYREHAGRLTPEEYVERVVAGELRDQALNAHLKAGYRVRAVHMGYLRDEESLDYATFLELENPDFNAARRRIAAAPIRKPVRRVRVTAGQYQMRPIRSWDDFERQVEFFVAAAGQYHSHFLLLPELFTAQLFSTMPRDLPGPEAIGRLADMKERFCELFTRLSRESGLHIIAGSTPVRVGAEIRNRAMLFTPAGDCHGQEKLQVTPNERREYGISPGDGLHVFDTGLARIAIVICYDIEFPELARLYTEAGAEILFVPFSTDERKAYMRVRYTAQARAVENFVYVVLAGNVGNLPGVDNFLINYGQAVMCTPCDFAFPKDGVAASAESTGETVVVADLDLGALEMAREMGSVRPLRDLRRDLYRVDSTHPVRVIRTG